MKKTIALALSLAFACSSAYAGIDGVWSTKEACEWRKKFDNDPTAVPPDKLFDFVYLSSDGLEGYEWGCSFLKSYEGKYGETLNLASCSAEGDEWPQMMITSYHDDQNGWGVSVLNAKNEPERIVFPVRCK